MERIFPDSRTGCNIAGARFRQMGNFSIYNIRSAFLFVFRDLFDKIFNTRIQVAESTQKVGAGRAADGSDIQLVLIYLTAPDGNRIRERICKGKIFEILDRKYYFVLSVPNAINIFTK